MRRLLEDVASGRAGSGLIGCDSWAWAYLQRVWPLPQPELLTLKAFGGADLARLFKQLAPPSRRGRLLFRNARSGRESLVEDAESEAVSQEIEQLAAHCRGNVGIARRYWRESLRAEPESAEAELADDEARDPRDEVIWVRSMLDEGALPIEGNEDQVLLLHALLLHNGLAEDLLPEVLPLPRHSCVSIAQRLRGLGLLEQADGRWQVDALAYAMVRRLLRGRDHLVDPF